MTIDSPPSHARDTMNRTWVWRSVVSADAGPFLTPGLVVLVIVAALSAYLTLQSDETAVLGRSANELRLINLQLNNKIADAETGQRGYLLTSDPAYLVPYEEAVRDIPQLTRELMGLSAGDPRRQALASRAEHLVEIKLGEMQKTLELQKAGNTPGAVAIPEAAPGSTPVRRLR